MSLWYLGKLLEIYKGICQKETYVTYGYIRFNSVTTQYECSISLQSCTVSFLSSNQSGGAGGICQKSVSVGESLLSFEALCLVCVRVWKQLRFTWHRTCWQKTQFTFQLKTVLVNHALCVQRRPRQNFTLHVAQEYKTLCTLDNLFCHHLPSAFSFLSYICLFVPSLLFFERL